MYHETPWHSGIDKNEYDESQLWSGIVFIIFYTFTI